LPAVATLEERTACPLCGSHSDVVFQSDGYPIRDCDVCRHRFAGFHPNEDHLAAVYGDDYFFAGGAGYPNYLKNEQLLLSHGRRLARKIAHSIQPGSMLDVGCAAGFILKGFQSAGWTGQGIEPNRRMAEFAAEYCHTRIHVGSLDDDDSEEQFDLVTLIQLIAHFDDPKQEIAAALSRVKPGGCCLVETWNVESWSARLLGAAWHEYSPPSVLHWFSFDRLVSLFEELGCQQLGGGRLVKWITGHHGKSLVESKLPVIPGGKLAAPFLRLIPDNLSCPYLSDDLVWLLFRKQS
jgi:SAM-dependent methyltransferase